MLVLYTLPVVVKDRVLQAQGRKFSSDKSKKFCVTLGAIVVLYLVCNTPRLLLNFMDHFSSPMDLFISCKCIVNPVHLESFVLLSHLFLVINSAVNFLIYFSVSRRFKKVVISKLLTLRKRNKISCEIENSQLREAEKFCTNNL